MSLTVIVYCYKNELYFEHCLATLANQTLKDIQWLFLNDGATADIKKIKSYFPNAQIMSFEKPIGMLAASEIGIRHANTDYCVFQRGWDYNDADRFRFQLELLKTTYASSVVCLPRFLRESGIDQSENPDVERVKKLCDFPYHSISTRGAIPSNWLSCWMFARGSVSFERVTQIANKASLGIPRVPRNYAEELIRYGFVSEGFLISGRVLVTLNQRVDLVYFEQKNFDSMKEYHSP